MGEFDRTNGFVSQKVSVGARMKCSLGAALCRSVALRCLEMVVVVGVCSLIACTDGFVLWLHACGVAVRAFADFQNFFGASAPYVEGSLYTRLRIWLAYF